MTIHQVWTPKSVSRPTPEGFAVLAIRAEYRERQDTFFFRVDGVPFEWHRRGARWFKTRSECAAYIKENGWPRV